MKISLDENQEQAVKVKRRNVLVVAAPGSGKTTVIINRVNYLIDKVSVQLGKVFIITFTRSAADNMRERYRKVFNTDRSPFFGTFHGLFYKLLLNEGYKINIINGGVIHNIIKGVLSGYFDDVNEDKVREIISNISNYKTSKLSIDEFELSISKDIFLECFEKYEEYKKKNNLWDFDDLSVTIINLLENDMVIQKKYMNLFKFVLVDEFQDCDDLQIRFLELINKNNSLFAVGDEDQCIYSFRGSKPQYMLTFNEIFKDGIKLYLTTNYRSRRNIVSLSKKLISNNISRNHKIIESDAENTGIVRYYRPTDEGFMGMQIAANVKEHFSGDYREFAVLYRTNMEARSIIDSFTKEKIPFLLLDKGYNFFEHFISVDILNYLKLAINTRDRELFCSIINKPFRYISKANINYIKNLQLDICPFEALIEKDDTPPFQRKKLDELKKDINYLNKISLGSAIQYIISSLGYYDYLKEYGERYGQNLSDLEDVLEEFKEATKEFRSINELLIHVRNVSEEIEKGSKNKNGVILSTIHGVKGMEFKNVFIINAIEDIIPHKTSVDNNLEEERRLFYVGITRAINNLYVFSPKKFRGKTVTESRFIDESGFKEEAFENQYGMKKGSSVEHIAYGKGIIESILKDKVEIDFGDGIIRAFSLRVLIENNLLKKCNDI